MSAAVAHRGTLPRRILGELDPQKDLNIPRGLYKREPIVFEQENEEAVLEGLQLGTYDFDEVMELTNFRLPFPAAATRDYGDSGDERVRFEAGAFQRHGMNDEELMEGMEEDEDDLLGDDAMADDLVEEMGDHDEENSDSGDEMQGQAFNPAALGLKEINNLAHFGVSSHRPGNGVAELLSDDLDKYWQ
jgi:anaphase-promoting complex subunit 10